MTKDFDEYVNSILEACWKGYKKVGMKKKGKRIVPDCVPVKENDESFKKTTQEKNQS